MRRPAGRRPGARRLAGAGLGVALALGLFAPLRAAAPAATRGAAAPVASDPCRGSATTALDALQLLELQISYTTLLARYYRPVDPAVVVRGAHDGIVAQLRRCGVTDTRRLITKKNQDGSERVDADFLTALDRYHRHVSAGALVAAAIEGELAAMHDPYTEYFRPAAFGAFNTFLRGEQFGGVGLVLDASGANPRVTTVVPESPAEKAGLRAGDVIDAIGDVATTGKSPGQLSVLLRGAPGSVARLVVSRDGTALPPIDVVRAVIRDPQTIARLLSPRVGYVQLTRFGDGAASEVRHAVDDLKAQGATAFVLDLRDDGGGYGDAATGVASIFVRAGRIYATRERSGPLTTDDAKGDPPLGAPLAVLVNHDTASAAEIVAGAIQDHGAGTIVGTRTFGKGVVQSIFPLPDGAAIKMTTARYFTPNGRDIDHRGIEPDVVVTEPVTAHRDDPAADPQLARAIAIVVAARAAATPASLEASPSASPAPTPSG